MQPYQRAELRIRDEHARQYDRTFLTIHGHTFSETERRMFVEALRQIPQRQQERLLDVGAGTGRITIAVERLFATTVATDISAESLSLLRQRLPGALCVVGDMTRGMPIASNSFVAVVACQVLQHFSRSDEVAALRETSRLLAPKGRLFVAGSNAGYWRHHGVRELTFANGLYLKRHERDELLEIARLVGLRVVSVKYYRALPLKRLDFALAAALDRIICRLPSISRRLGAFVFITLEKP